MKHPTSILVELHEGGARVTLNRPDRRNAFNARMVAEVCEAFKTLGQDHSVRVIVLTGSGPTFCAGADLGWMGTDRIVSASEAQQDAERLLAMFRTIDACPCPVIGRVQGAAYGGGIGLIAACDITVAAASATFAFSEVRLGLVPAVIAPFVLTKTGESFVRRFCLTGESFSAGTAQAAGLIHDVVEPVALDAHVASLVEQINRLAPQAVRDTKELFQRLHHLSQDERWKACIEGNVQARLSSEAQEGLRAFRERRTPDWVPSTGGM
ncbi:MAG: enoyl-CoA hydratase [Nitrospira sp. LK265]|nr:enoyl-CoA hydratase-related protein [Nitrospira sp.]NGZ59060.1 enoyl-CoA hydratase [Nitrospira sp. LK265]